MLKIGETVYRVFDPHDGGGYFEQSLTALEVASDYTVFKLFDGSTILLKSDEISVLYSSKFE